MKNLKKTMIFMVSILLLITGSIIGAKNVKADNEIPWTFYQGDLIRYYFEGVYQPITPDTVYVGTDNYNYYRKMRIFNVNFPGQTSFHKTWNSDESYKLYIGLSKSATNASSVNYSLPIVINRNDWDNGEPVTGIGTPLSTQYIPYKNFQPTYSSMQNSSEDSLERYYFTFGKDFMSSNLATGDYYVWVKLVPDNSNYTGYEGPILKDGVEWVSGESYDTSDYYVLHVAENTTSLEEEPTPTNPEFKEPSPLPNGPVVSGSNDFYYSPTGDVVPDELHQKWTVTNNTDSSLIYRIYFDYDEDFYKDFEEHPEKYEPNTSVKAPIGIIASTSSLVYGQSYTFDITSICNSYYNPSSIQLVAFTNKSSANPTVWSKVLYEKKDISWVSADSQNEEYSLYSELSENLHAGNNVYIGELSDDAELLYSRILRFYFTEGPVSSSDSRTVSSYSISLVKDDTSVEILPKTTNDYDYVDFGSISSDIESQLSTGSWTINATVYGDDNSSIETKVLGTLYIVKNEAPKVEAHFVDGSGNDEDDIVFYYGNNVPDSLKTSLKISVSDNTINTSNGGLVLKLYRTIGYGNDELVATYNGASGSTPFTFDVWSDITNDEAGIAREYFYVISDGLYSTQVDIATINPVVFVDPGALTLNKQDFYYTGDVSDSYYDNLSNKQFFNVALDTSTFGRNKNRYSLTKLQVYLDDTLLKEYSTNSGTVTVNIKDFPYEVRKNLNGDVVLSYVMEYKYQGMFRTITYTGSGLLGNFKFKKNTAPSLDDVELQHADGHYYSKDVRDSLKTKLLYTFNDDSYNTNLSASFYYTIGGNENNYQMPTVGTTEKGIYTRDFSALNLFNNSEQNVTIHYVLSDGISDDVTGVINNTPINFESVSKVEIYKNENKDIDNRGITISNTFGTGNEKVIYYGDVKDSAKSTISFTASKALQNNQIKVNFGPKVFNSLVSSGGSSDTFLINLSNEGNYNQQTGNRISIQIDDGISDTVTYWVDKDGNITTKNMWSTSYITEENAFGFNIYKNEAPKFDRTNSSVSIPSINNGVIYTNTDSANDVRSDRASSLNIKVTDDSNNQISGTDKLYKVFIGDGGRETVARYSGNSSSTVDKYDLTASGFDGNKYLYIVIDDGIAPASVINIDGTTVNESEVANKTALNFKKNKQPSIINAKVSNSSTGNVVYYGDVNIEDKISALNFSASFSDIALKKEYKIYNGNFSSDVDERYFDSAFSPRKAKTYESSVNYNLTDKNYDKFVASVGDSNSRNFNLYISLDDDIAEPFMYHVGNYTFKKNTRPSLDGTIIYGTGYNNKTFTSVFTGLDESAEINQKIETNLSDTLFEKYTYVVSEVDNAGNIIKDLETKVSTDDNSPVFSLSEYSKNHLLDDSGKAIMIHYSDGIWDSDIANSNLRLNVKFSKAGKPEINGDSTYLTGAYPYNGANYIYDIAMKSELMENGDKPFNGVNFSVSGKSANTEIYLSEAVLEYSVNNGNSWNTVTDKSRNPLISLDSQTSTSFTKQVSNWMNYTTNSNNAVKFRFRVVDELGQESVYTLNEDDTFYLVKEYKPGRISRFNIYNKGTQIAYSGSLKKGTTYTFRWGTSSDANQNAGDKIVKYVIKITNGSNVKTLDISDSNFVDWACDVEGDSKFEIYAIDRFGLESSILTMIRSANQNQIPDEVVDVTSTQTTIGNNSFIKVYGTTAESRALTTYTLTFTNAGDPDEEKGKGDYVESWEVQYSTKEGDADWHFLKTINNTGNQVKTGETVSTTFYITEGSVDTAGATSIRFRVIAKDTEKETMPSLASDSYTFTDDNKAPVWSDIDNNLISFHSPDGGVIRINSTLRDASEISYVIVNGEEITDKTKEAGAKEWSYTNSNRNEINLIYTIFKNGQYWFRIGDIYGNEYSQRFNAENIDQVPPVIEVSQEIAESTATNRPYNLNIVAVDNLTGIKKIEVTEVGIDEGATPSTTGTDSSIEGQTQVNFTKQITKPGDYTIKVWDRAENLTTKTLSIDNINNNKPTFTYSVPEELKNKKLTISLDATVTGTRKTGALGEFRVMNSSTIKTYGEFKTTSSDGTNATIEVSQNGTLDVRFVDIFGNESDIQHIVINNILVGDIDNEVKYLMLASDYNANYTEKKPTVRINGVDYVEWNNKQSTEIQLYAYIELSADFNGLQYGWFDTNKNGTSNITYWSSYENGDISKPDRLLFKFNSARKAFYIIDIFGNYTQVVASINGYTAPPACEINYQILNKELTSDNVDVFFEVTSGRFIDEGFYKETIDGVSKNLYNDFVWGTIIDGQFVADNAYKEKSFKYTFKENGSLTVWGRSNVDDSEYVNVRVTITNIDKTTPIVDIEDFDTSLVADKLTVTAHTNSSFLTLDEFKEKMVELGNSLTESEINSYSVSADGKTASITFENNNQGIFFFAKNSVGTLGNSRSITISNIYKSNLSMDLIVYLEDGSSIPYEQYAANRSDYSGVITVRASATSLGMDGDGKLIPIRFDKDDNKGCEIVSTPLSNGGNMVSATYVFTSEGSYTFVLKDAYTGVLEKTVYVGSNTSEPAEKPTIKVTQENIKGENVPYVVKVNVTLSIEGTNDFVFTENSSKTISKEIEENGRYLFEYSDGKNIYSQEVNVSSIYVYAKPRISVDYDSSFTTGTVTLTATVSSGVFVDYDSNWRILTDVNGKPTSMQRVVSENTEIVLYAKDFYEDNSSLVEEKVSITNIDRQAPLDPDITYDVDSNGLLNIVLNNNGDNGTSGTASYKYHIYNDSYNQEGTVLVNEAIISLSSSDGRFADGKFNIDVITTDNAGNSTTGISTAFYSDDKKVKEFNQTYNNILGDANLNNNKDFYNDIVLENRAALVNYANDVQKDYVEAKLDLIQSILTSDDSAQAVLIARIEDGLRSLSKNPSDKALANTISGYIDNLTDATLKASYSSQLSAILNMNSVIENKKKATTEFNYNINDYTVNPVSGVITKNSVEGYFDADGNFVRGITADDYYYLENGKRYPIDLTFRTFTDPKGNSMDVENGQVNNSYYYDNEGTLVGTRYEGGFYDWLSRWHERASLVTYYTVTFVDFDGSSLKVEKVAAGKSASAPSNPSRSGYTFSGWDKDFSNITANLTVTALYTENGSGEIITPTPTPTGTPGEITPTPTPTEQEDIKPTLVSLNRTFASIYVGDYVVLQASVAPAGSKYTLNWSSSNTSVATVSDGVVRGISLGTATIYAVTDNNVVGYCNITVVDSSSSGEVVIPGKDDYPTISDIVTPTPAPTNPVADAPSFNVGTFGGEGVGYTSTTNFDSSNLRGFYNNGYSTLIYNGDGTFDITNKRNANVNLGFLSGGVAVIMSSKDIDSNLSVSSFGLNGTTLSINSGRLGNSSYIVLFTDYNQNTTVKKDGTNIASDYDYNLGGYKIYNPQAGTYTLGSITSTNISDTDLAAMYGFITDSYSGNITYREIVKMAYNALNRDFGEELFSDIPTNSPIYRELSILEKYGVIDSSINSYYPNIDTPVTGKDAYDILYMTLSQTAPSNISYNPSEWRYLQGVSLQQINSMVANIVQ